MVALLTEAGVWQVASIVGVRQVEQHTARTDGRLKPSSRQCSSVSWSGLAEQDYTRSNCVIASRPAVKPHRS